MIGDSGLYLARTADNVVDFKIAKALRGYDAACAEVFATDYEIPALDKLILACDALREALGYE